MLFMTLTTVNRAIYFNVLLLLSLTDWLFSYFRPDLNAGNWLAAAAGAFVIRFALPKLPIKASVGGWLVGFLIACIFAPDVVATGGLWGIKRSVGVHGAVAVLGDLIIQLIAFAIRLSTKVGGGIYEHPGQSFDEGLERVEKVTNVWVRIKAPFMDLLNTIFKKS